MGCAHSTRPSMNSPPPELEKLMIQNRYAKTGIVGARRSTGGLRRSMPETGRVPKPEAKNGSGNGVVTGRASLEGKWDVKEGGSACGDEGKKSSDGGNNGNVRGRNELDKKPEEDELVDGWPKWLRDNIPRQVLRNIVLKTADSYTKIDKVGQGTYSNVYKARDNETGKIVALKKVRFDTSEPESVRFMAREIMILKKLDHPNIVKLEGLATSRMQYSLYLVFEFFHSDLSRILSQPDQLLSEPQVKCYMQQLLSGLQHCHENGVLHRDIKGSNLLIDRNGMLKIADFGLANIFNPEKRRPLTNRVVTLWYRAPELLLGCTDYGVGIDLWSAGCLMAEMFAGRPILPGRTEVEQLHRIFKLCGTPPDEYYKKMKISTSLKPPQTYKSSLRENFRYFPPSSLGLLYILLAIAPEYRGSAASALHNEYFHMNPLACDLSGLPVIHVEDDDQTLVIEKRRHRTSKARRQSQSHREHRKKSISSDQPEKRQPEACKEEPRKSAGTSVFSTEPGSSKSSSSTTSVNPTRSKGSPAALPLPSPIVPNYKTSPKSEARRSIKNRPPLPTAKRFTAAYNPNLDIANKYDLVSRSASTREFRSVENNLRLKLLVQDD